MISSDVDVLKWKFCSVLVNIGGGGVASMGLTEAIG